MWVDEEGKIHRNQPPVPRPVRQPARPAPQPVRPAPQPARPPAPVVQPQQAQEIQRLNLLVQQLNNQLIQERNQRTQAIQQLNSQLNQERNQHAVAIQQQANQLNQGVNQQVQQQKKQKKAVVIGFGIALTCIMIIILFVADFSSDGALVFTLLLVCAGIAITVGAFGEGAAITIMVIYAIIGGIIGIAATNEGFFASLIGLLIFGFLGYLLGCVAMLGWSIAE